MSGVRSLCLAGIRCAKPFQNVRTFPNLQRPAALKISPLAVAYSKDARSVKNAAEVKRQDNESSAGTFGETDVKLPSKDQIQSFVFKSLVHLWDVTFYLFCLCRKLFEQYVLSNSVVRRSWKEFQKRMEDARRDLKEK